MPTTPSPDVMLTTLPPAGTTTPGDTEPTTQMTTDNPTDTTESTTEAPTTTTSTATTSTTTTSTTTASTTTTSTTQAACQTCSMDAVMEFTDLPPGTTDAEIIPFNPTPVYDGMAQPCATYTFTCASPGNSPAVDIRSGPGDTQGTTIGDPTGPQDETTAVLTCDGASQMWIYQSGTGPPYTAVQMRCTILPPP
ncbi:hypothetical protein WR25_00575 [Diploscapter pachys]|uniref:C6 domain-containing protein n=1 Tax=Diploscapter pachys TaxID=2018661 RepID=A0A2A2JJW0_9BILA|nr:hypothetical protein WR25_00575 [Diploscapter pachys]